MGIEKIKAYNNILNKRELQLYFMYVLSKLVGFKAKYSNFNIECLIK